MQTCLAGLFSGVKTSAPGPPPQRPVGRPQMPNVNQEEPVLKRGVGRPRNMKQECNDVVLAPHIVQTITALVTPDPNLQHLQYIVEPALGRCADVLEPIEDDVCMKSQHNP